MAAEEILTGKRVLVTGGTGSLGSTIVRRLLSAELGLPERITVYSRDEAKQHEMRLAYQHRAFATDEIIYHNFERTLQFQIGDVRDPSSLSAALRNADVVFNAAALKQVPTCEYFPYEAVRTNVGGAENIIRCIRDAGLPVETVVGVSTDKAAKPVNVMGMTKAIQERIFIRANLDCPDTRFVCVRYGNVLSSRGSAVPLFQEQISRGGPVTITAPEMTRFLLSLEEAVDTIFEAARTAGPGETYVPRAASAKITDVAAVLIGERDIPVVTTGIRPGEKMHEVLVSEEEVSRTVARDDHLVILPILPELRGGDDFEPALDAEYSSADTIVSRDEVAAFLRDRGAEVPHVVAEPVSAAARA